MTDDKEIYLPDTTVKYKVLKDKLKEVYGLELTDTSVNNQKSIKDLKKDYVYGGIIVFLSLVLLYKTFK